MLKKIINKVLVVTCFAFIFAWALVGGAQAAVLNSFVLTNENEFDTTLLTFSLGETGQFNSVAAEFSSNLSTGNTADIYNFNYVAPGTSTPVNVYITSSDFTFAMGETGNLDAAIKMCVDYSEQFPPSKLVTLYSNNGVDFSLIFQGATIMAANSSLEIGRHAQGYGTDIISEWTASSVSSQSNNPIGQIKYSFEKDLDKSTVDNIGIYLNGSTTEPVAANEIKTLLFGEFVERDLAETQANELSADIILSYDELKAFLSLYNDGNTVNQIKIVGKATDGSDTSFTININ